MVFETGDLVWIRLPLVPSGKEPKRRPAVVIDQVGSDLLLANISIKADLHQEYPNAVGFTVADLVKGGMTRPCLIRVDKTNSIPSKFCERFGLLSQAKVDEILRAYGHYIAGKYYEHFHAPRSFIPGQSPVPVSGRVYGPEELQTLVDASFDFWLTTGRFNEAFEKELERFLNVRHVLTTNSGSSANLLALSALTSSWLGDDALVPGDEVITVAAGFPTTVNPILQNGLVPVFVDVTIPTYNVDVAQLEGARSDRTRAVMLAHTLGNTFDLGSVIDFVRKYDLWLIEDCCDALGSTYKGQSVGTFGDIGTVSFYPAHHITMGEGGAVFTNNGKLSRIVESFRDWGRDCWCNPGKDNTCGKRFGWQLGGLPSGYDHKYIYSHMGYNLKITDMQAAIGLAQMARLPEFIKRRKDNFQYLKKRLSRLEEFLVFPEATAESDPSWFGFPITLRENAPASLVDLLRYLDQQKIGTRLLFAGNITRQPYFEGRPHRIGGVLKNTDVIMNKTFWIGVYPGLTEPMLDYLAAKLEAFFEVTH